MAAAAWSAIARQDAKPPPPLSLLASASSKSGLSMLVLDTGMLLNSNVVYSLPGMADQFVTTAEAIEEIRDPASRAQLASLPFKLHTLEASHEALTKVVQFARATGDLHTLSDVDLKLLALTYTLEVEAHGSSHLRARPPPLQLVPKPDRALKEPPGWGSNVPNLEEWENLGEEEEEEFDAEVKSRILGLQGLSLSVADESTSDLGDNLQQCGVDGKRELRDLDGGLGDRVSRAIAFETQDNGQNCETSDDSPSDQLHETRGSGVDLAYSSTKQPARLEENGFESKKGQDEEEFADWQKACSRSTRRKHLKRAARGNAEEHSVAEPVRKETGDDETYRSLIKVNAGGGNSNKEDLRSHEGGDLDDLPELLDAEEDECERWHQASDGGNEERDDNGSASQMGNEFSLEKADVVPDGHSSTVNDDAATRNSDGNDSKHSVGFRSNIGCMTGDFAMQNVLVQMGLRLVSAGGVQVKELQRWMLKCQACGHLTSEAGRLFCPKCGNGGTLYRISVTVGANGSLHAGPRHRVNLRGTRYSLPLPKGGREGAAQNPILREDQLPQKLLKPKIKKVSFDEGLDSFGSADVLTKTSKANARKGPGIKEAAAIFSGRKNPNERRVFRRH